MHLTQEKEAVMHIRVPKRRGISKLAEWLLASEEAP
jgi:hypothetical protein